MPDICKACGANRAKSPAPTCPKRADGKHEWQWSTDPSGGSTPTGGKMPSATGKK